MGIDALCKLQIMKPLNDIASDCTFLCAPEDVRYIAERNWQKGQSFEDLLTTFIALFGEFGTDYWGFSTDRDLWFEPGAHLCTVLTVLAEIGYASEERGHYRWTKKIYPVMSAPRTNFWPPNEEAG